VWRKGSADRLAARADRRFCMLSSEHQRPMPRGTAQPGCTFLVKRQPGTLPASPARFLTIGTVAYITQATVRWTFFRCVSVLKESAEILCLKRLTHFC
jgi:hypothetical protein